MQIVKLRLNSFVDEKTGEFDTETYISENQAEKLISGGGRKAYKSLYHVTGMMEG